MGDSHLLKFSIGEESMGMLMKHARMKCLGGNSHIRGDDRQEKLLEDQVIGLIGTFAFSHLMFGSDEKYIKHVWTTGDKWEGDGGTDVPGARVDIKTSLMRANSDPMSYNLLVRPKEIHPQTTYVLVLISEYGEELSRGVLVGWMDVEEVVVKAVSDERFGDAFVVPATQLHPLIPMRWGR